MKKNVFYLKAALLSLVLHYTATSLVQAQDVQAVVASKEITLTGKVTDESGSPLAGVTVQVKDGKTLYATDDAGNFTVSVMPGTVLQFNSSGFALYEHKVTNAGSLSIRLTIANKMLDDIVVVGYGTVRKKDLTGSVSSVKAADIVRSPAHNALEALQGQVPGLDITRNSGRATSGITMNIRGKRSLSTARDESNNLIANNPLVIIDGVQGGNIADIPPQDIESIDVMKDAASTAIYGYQGANGVIIVTTKRGKPGKQRISYNGYVGMNGWAQYPKMLTGDSYIQLRREASRTAGQWTSPANDASLFTPEEWLAVQKGQWFDWVDEVNHVGIVQNHQVTVSGGSVKTTGLLSAGYYREKGSLKDDVLDKFNLRLAVDHNFSDIFKAGASANLTNYKGYERADNALWRAATNVPLGNAYDSLGRVLLFPLGTSGKVNPLADEASEFVAKHQRINTNVQANGYAELKPLKNLSIKTVLGTNLGYRKNSDFEGANAIDRAGLFTTSLASVLSSQKSFITWDNVVNYNKTVGSNHSFGLTALTSWTKALYQSTYSEGSGQLVPSQLWHNLGANDRTSYVINSTYIQSQTMSYAARLNYNFMGRYLLAVSNRWDGASRLAQGNKWASFPSVAVAWRLIDEKWFAKIKSLNELKIRLTWGMTGNSGISEYGTESYLLARNNSAFQNRGYVYYTYSSFLGNKDLGWERSASTNLGVDFGLFKNRVYGSIDLYNTKTTDVLLPRTLPTSMGSGNNTPFQIYQNIGSTNNKGLEVNLTTVNVKKGKLTWTTNITFSTNKERITSLIDGRNIIGAVTRETQTLIIGKPLNSFYTFKNLGVWQTSEATEAATYFKDPAKTQPFKPGDLKLADLNGDKIIDETNDVTYIGATSPKWLAGLNNTVRIGNFDVNVYLIARWGHLMQYDFTAAYDPQGKNNQPAYLNYWTPENPSNDFPRPALTNFFNYRGYQALNYIDASYAKIKTVSIGYTLPGSVAGKLKMNNLRLYGSVNNLYTINKSHLVKDYDPERGGSARAPLQRQLVFGINAEL